jgi:hypothetical protein
MHYIEYKRHRAIVRKMIQRQRRDDWNKFVKTLERDIAGTQRRSFKCLNSYNCQKEINSKLIRQKKNGREKIQWKTKE